MELNGRKSGSNFWYCASAKVTAQHRRPVRRRRCCRRTPGGIRSHRASAARRATRSAGEALAISCAANSGRSACTIRSGARPSRLNPPVGVPSDVEAERRHEADVLQRGHRAKARHVEIRSAELDRKVVALRVRKFRIVTGRARHCAGCGQARIAEDLLTECDGIGTFGMARCRNDARAHEQTEDRRAQSRPTRRSSRTTSFGAPGAASRIFAASPVLRSANAVDRHHSDAVALVYQGWLAGA